MIQFLMVITFIWWNCRRREKLCEALKIIQFFLIYSYICLLYDLFLENSTKIGKCSKSLFVLKKKIIISTNSWCFCILFIYKVPTISIIRMIKYGILTVFFYYMICNITSSNKLKYILLLFYDIIYVIHQEWSGNNIK